MKVNDMNSAQLAEYYHGLEEKNYMYYQQSGEPRYDNAAYKYGKISEAFYALVEKENERGDEIKKRMVNMQGVVDRLIPSKTYTKAEVEKLLREAVWW